MPPGYHGAYLRIDVSRLGGGAAEGGRPDGVERVPLDESTLRQFLGGSGLGVRLLLDEEAAHLDPLAADAPLVFAFSPLVGSPLTTSVAAAEQPAATRQRLAREQQAFAHRLLV